jgi:hypothetical protein
MQDPPLRQRAGDLLHDWLKHLMATSSGDDASVKQAIAIALGNLQMSEARSLLQTLAQDSDAQTQLYANAALRQLAD